MNEMPKVSVEDVQRVIAGELSPRARIGHTLLLLIALAFAIGTVSLWMTEPSLPARTHVAFGAILVIALSWACYAAWVLTRRRVLLAGHRIVAARMAIAFSALFTAGAAAIDQWPAVILGGVMTVIAIAMFIHARRKFARLAQRRDALERTLKSGAGAGTFAAALFLVCIAGLSVQADVPLTVTETTVRVPETRGGANAGGEIVLAVVRVQRDAKPSRNAHVILAGGPGDSGVTLVRGMAARGGAALFELFDGDVIGIDQRGTGASQPNLQVQRPYNLPLDAPGSRELWLPFIEAASREAASQFTGKGVNLAAYNTRESADDIDAVRRALGYDRITLWGRSYGSHLALAVLRRHERSVTRAILVNPEGPDDTFKLPSEVDAVLARVIDPTIVRDVLSQLEKKPVAVDGIAIGAFDVQLLTAQALSDPRTASTIPAAYEEMANGDYRRIAKLVAMQRTRMGVQSAMKQMMDLSSGATKSRRDRIAREAATSPLGNAINFPTMDLDAAWGSPDLGDAFRAPVRSDVPVLIIAGDRDPRTPVSNGQAMLEHLPNGQLVVVKDAGHHFDLFGSPAMRALLREFLTEGRVSTTAVR